MRDEDTRFAPKLGINRVLYSLILLHASLIEIVPHPLIHRDSLSTLTLRLSDLLTQGSDLNALI
jgi:hypothetical protein